MWREDQLLGALLERAGRLAGPRVADDDAVARVRRVAIDAGDPERGRVHPGGVAVVAAHERRPVRHDRVQLLAGRQAAGERDVHPAVTLDPGVARVRGRVGRRSSAGWRPRCRAGRVPRRPAPARRRRRGCGRRRSRP